MSSIFTVAFWIVAGALIYKFFPPSHCAVTALPWLVCQ